MRKKQMNTNQGYFTEAKQQTDRVKKLRIMLGTKYYSLNKFDKHNIKPDIPISKETLICMITDLEQELFESEKRLISTIASLQLGNSDIPEICKACGQEKLGK